jgi:hypothetical protein
LQLKPGVSEAPAVAIVFAGRTLCALCGEPLQERDDVVATTHFIGDATDPLWAFSDAGMHRGCFLGWSLKTTFVERYNSVAATQVAGNGTRSFMQPDGTIVVQQAVGLLPCPCCRFLTLSQRALDEICSVCFWQDDGQDDPEADEVWGGPNGDLSLSQARKNYAAFGAVESRFKQNVRPPEDDEKPPAR